MDIKVNIPNRRKSKDNPYTLDYVKDTNNYIVTFKDTNGNTVKVKISTEVYSALDKFELEDISQLHEYERHIEHSEIYENNLNKRAFNKEKGVEDIVEENILSEQLKEAINKLPENQRRRIKMYYFDGLTQKEIAEIECVNIRSVQYTLKIAIDNLKEILKKFKF